MSPNDDVHRSATTGVTSSDHARLWVIGLSALLIALGFGERRATATSLCAIVIIAAVATALQGAYGNVRLGDAALLIVPAVAGAGIGVAVQQRIPERTVSLLFALLLFAVAAELIVP